MAWLGSGLLLVWVPGLAQEALRRSEERFSKAFIASPVPMVIQSFQSRRFVDVNQSFLELTGFSRAELIGHSAEELGIWREESPEELEEEHPVQEGPPPIDLASWIPRTMNKGMSSSRRGPSRSKGITFICSLSGT